MKCFLLFFFILMALQLVLKFLEGFDLSINPCLILSQAADSIIQCCLVRSQLSPCSSFFDVLKLLHQSRDLNPCSWGRFCSMLRTHCFLLSTEVFLSLLYHPLSISLRLKCRKLSSSKFINNWLSPWQRIHPEDLGVVAFDQIPWPSFGILRTNCFEWNNTKQIS